eukprot:4359803-Lingulodinium_polyedra.AAC.1
MPADQSPRQDQLRSATMQRKVRTTVRVTAMATFLPLCDKRPQSTEPDLLIYLVRATWLIIC